MPQKALNSMSIKTSYPLDIFTLLLRLEINQDQHHLAFLNMYTVILC